MKTYKYFLDYYQNKFKQKNLDEYAAKYLLAYVLNVETNEIFNYYNEVSNKKCIKKYEKICNQYLKYAPPQYITHQSYFYYLNLYVDKSVLIPRKETEELVELFLNDYKDCYKLKVLDMCCGSGCIGLAIKNKHPQFDVTCSDISKNALKVAKKNSSKLNIDIQIIQSNLFDNIVDDFDVLICNPPYIKLGDCNVDKSTLLYEPKLALFTNDKDGIEFYDLIFRQLVDKKFQKAYFEFGYDQKQTLSKLLNKYSLKGNFFKDLSGNDRMLVITK